MKPSQSTFGFRPLPDARAESPDHNPDHSSDEPQDALLSPPRYQVLQFHSDILSDDRAVSVFLPAAYELEQERRFPVFYLHDGQNLFDGRTSYVPGCTWRAHRTAEELTEANAIRPLILVGIANTGLRRMPEYTPTRDYKMGGGEGTSYGRLIMDELKPLVDERFRTLPGPDDTGLGGSSLGGLISLFLGLKHPDVFGRLAVLSPSLWWDHRSILNLATRVRPSPGMRMWLDMGTAEGVRHLRDADLLFKALVQHGWIEGESLHYARVQDGLHNEEAWASRFGDVLRFLFPVV